MYTATETTETYVNVPNGLWTDSQKFAMRLLSMARLLDMPVCDNYTTCMNETHRRNGFWNRATSSNSHRRVVGVAWPDGRVHVICSDPVQGKGYHPSSYIWSHVVHNYFTVKITNTTWMEHRCEIQPRHDSRQAFIKEMETVCFPRPWMSYSRPRNEIPGATITHPNRTRMNYLFDHVLCKATRTRFLDAWARQDKEWWMEKSDHLMVNSVNNASIVKIDEHRYMLIDPEGQVETEHRSSTPMYYPSFDVAFNNANNKWHVPLKTTKLLEAA